MYIILNITTVMSIHTYYVMCSLGDAIICFPISKRNVRWFLF